jgi:GNAT superfamily N-acetyltransferase
MATSDGRQASAPAEKSRNALAEGFKVRSALPGDLPSVVALVRALADFEKLPAPDDEAAARLIRDATSADPPFHLLVGEDASGAVVAYAAYFTTYSTFLAKRSLYLEDLFVHPDARGKGLGEELLRRLAVLAVERGCARFDWCVLDWNVDAQRFYKRLGADVHSSWWTCRLEGDALAALGAAR